MEIFIKELQINTIIGLLPSERKFPQRVVVDAIFTCKDLPMQVDYAKASKMVENILKKEEFDTVEAALLELERKLKGAFPLITKLCLSLTKPDILPNAKVGAKLERDYS
jgi:dihydroneopterin aldolase